MTGIQWTDETWNPLRGCSRVSKGCKHCYAEQVARRFSGEGQPYEGLVRLDAKGKPKAQWNGTVREVPEKLDQPLRWTRPRMVFVNSMSDLFHEAVDFEYIAAVFGVMAAAHRHTFQVLTKRPERAAEFFAQLDAHNPASQEGYVLTVAERTVDHMRKGVADCRGWPPPNVWLGVSVEDQASADERIPWLLHLPAAVRWVSYEPALGPVRFVPWLEAGACLGGGVEPCGPERHSVGGLDWIVVGGESGSGARPFDIAWARATIEQCDAAGVPVFVKQLGSVARSSLGTDHKLGAVGRGWEGDGPTTSPRYNLNLSDRKGGDPSEWPADLRRREWPAVAA